MTGIAEQAGDLAARQAIADLVHRYGQVVRRDCPEQTADLYVENGVFEVRRGYPDKPDFTVQSRVEGREQIRAMLLATKGKPHPVPLIHNLMIEVDGDRASANCVMEGRGSVGQPGFWGEYRDECLRIDGRWHFVSRCYTMFVDGGEL